MGATYPKETNTWAGARPWPYRWLREGQGLK